MFTALVVLIVASMGVVQGHDEGVFHYVGADGTQHNRDKDDVQYYHTNSEVPHLPFLTGYFGTHGTYRFLTVTEQTATLIGEGKHGLWRMQENGHVREYRKRNKVGVHEYTDPEAPDALKNESLKKIIFENYAHTVPEEGAKGYKYPDEKISDGKVGSGQDYDNLEGYLNFIDISIYHPKYHGKYDGHVPIDLPYFYCLFTGPDYQHATEVWDFAKAQPNANKIGALGVRAGMDIKETHLNVLRLHLFDDAGIWANVGVGDELTDRKIKNLEEAKSKIQTLNYLRVDLSKMNHELYLMERPYYGQRYLFVVVILENKEGPSGWSYLRRHGYYWEGLKSKQNVTELIDQSEKYFPPVYIEEGNSTDRSGLQKIYGLPVYGIMHPDRHAFDLHGGICPARGGDNGRYPFGHAGGAFPNNYEEITPICDGLLLDIKLWNNLWTPSWNDKQLLLGNAGYPGLKQIEYIGDHNVYGGYTDPYLTTINPRENPNKMDLTGDGKLVLKEDDNFKVHLKLDFGMLGYPLNYASVDGLNIHQAESKSMFGQQHQGSGNQTNATASCENKDWPAWGIATVVIVTIILLLNVVAIGVLFVRRRPTSKANDVSDAKECHPQHGVIPCPKGGYENKGAETP